jgi:hypothetical protein
MMASEYKKRGGGYTTDKTDKDESQKHLDKWTDEEWQTKEGSGTAKQGDGTEKRYLPKAAWEKMSEEDKKETDDKKLEASKSGKQYVSNTTVAKQARKAASKNVKEGDKTTPKLEREDSVIEHESQNELKVAPNWAGRSESEDAEGADAKTSQKDEGNSRKRGLTSNQKGTNKKQKGKSDKQGPKGTAGSKSRLPRKGQQVQWGSLAGYVDGEVVEVSHERKTVEGKTVKATKDHPRIVLKSASSGKIAVHKPEAVFFT